MLFEICRCNECRFRLRRPSGRNPFETEVHLSACPSLPVSLIQNHHSSVSQRKRIRGIYSPIISRFHLSICEWAGNTTSDRREGQETNRVALSHLVVHRARVVEKCQELAGGLPDCRCGP